MKHPIIATVACVALGIAAFASQQAQAPQSQPARGERGAQPARGERGAQPQGQQPGRSGADPYANNALPGTTTFPLAAPAGKDSNALQLAPPGAVNQGPFDPATWKYGPAFNAPAGSKVWNPVRLKLMLGGK